mmetsp:Transcript_15160/g.33320  ORF Transcript_15160/g.33320 Transcript_15160/m.33320 type:complete len:243 (+) Transcript_15160:43-771(+)|eukprot:CAMPEP_0170591074 /NCGR_PEP_ID=MMETSP0224-20130122/12209_1 /TAXON_ID=285029 /ORGANISM="Togula jolla, Strain CCCM 725" /LENGTH=242 /DNA_ID=CAMNT_0010914913 /DNA_START=24 /DNA_END=752 /DNA_ORIENTATION=+
MALTAELPGALPLRPVAARLLSPPESLLLAPEGPVPFLPAPHRHVAPATVVGALCAAASFLLRRRPRASRGLAAVRAGGLAGSPASLGRASCSPCGLPRAVGRVQLRAFNEFGEDEEDEDGPDLFLSRQRNFKPKVVPAWNRFTSPSQKTMDQPAVFFFPQFKGVKSEENGWINPKMYKKARLPKKLAMRQRRDKKRAWRGLSNRLQDEWRFRRFPRDESGRVVPGLFQDRNRFAKSVGLRK